MHIASTRPHHHYDRRLPSRVRLLIMARAVNQLGACSLAFLTVLLTRDLGAGLTVAGAISAVFGLATIPSRLLGGRLADRWGARRTILTGLTGCAAAQLGLAAAPDLATAALCAVLLGLAFELYEPPSQAMIAESVAPDDRTAAYALLTTALAVGNLGAGLVADAVGHSSLRWLFVVDAASCLACAVIVRLALPGDVGVGADAVTGVNKGAYIDAGVGVGANTGAVSGGGAGAITGSGSGTGSAAKSPVPVAAPAAVGSAAQDAAPTATAATATVANAATVAEPAGATALATTTATAAEPTTATALAPTTPADPTAPSPAINPWRDRALLLMTGAGTIYALVYMLLLVSLPLSLTVDGLNPANAGLIMTVATVTLVLARPALRTRPLAALSPGAAFTAGYLLLAAGLAGYTFAHTLPALLAPTALYSLGNLLLMGRALAVVSELAPPGATARYLAVYGLSWGFATMLAPLLSTWLIGAFGPGTLWAAMATLCLVMAVAQPRLLPRIADEYADAAVTVADVEGEAKAAAAAITAADTEAVANAYFEFSAADGAATCADGPAVTTSPAHASVLVKANDGRI